MNYRLLSKYLGQFSLAGAILMLPSAAWAVWFGEWPVAAGFAVSILAAQTVGAVLIAAGWRAHPVMYQREALGLVGVGWLLFAAIGALPYVFTGVLGPVDAYFESMSGFTTTGSTVLVDIEATPRSVLFWRSFTHWLGGMGIVVLFIVVLPYLGAGGKQLYKSETPGPDPRGLSPRIKDTASILWKIYAGLTAIQTTLLMMAGMDLFDALCHTFGTLATGGFSTRQASVGAYDSLLVEAIIVFFMVVAGTNFALFFAMGRGDWGAPLRSTEWRIYIAILAGATLLVTLNLAGVQGAPPFAQEPPRVSDHAPPYGVTEALRIASFQVVSIMTTTGYATADFDAWPYFSRVLLVALMFIGGCAGSTGGGIKVIRVILLAKMAYWRLESTFRPKTVRLIRINDQVIDEGAQRTVYAFFVIYMTLLVGGTLFMSILGLPFESALTSVAATLNNIGPGLEFVGAVQDFHAIPDAGKIFLSLCMAAGRLELFTICVLFLPGFWRHS